MATTHGRLLVRSGVPHAGVYRDRVLATTVGELVAFSIPTVVWGLCAVAGLDDRVIFAAVVIAGAGEGAVLAFAQTRVLRDALPALSARSWVTVTAAAGAVAWAVGMSPSTFTGQWERLPLALTVPLAVAGGVTLLGSIGVAQWTVLRRHVGGAGSWVLANAAGWFAGLPFAVVALGLAPDPPALRAVVAIASGIAMGAAVASVTGASLMRLLRRPRSRPAPSLRHRARVRLNLVHALVYALTNGRSARASARSMSCC